MDATALWILLGATAASAAYAAVLERIHHLYAPDWIWLTVVGGNAMIGGAFALFCGLGYIPWLAFQLLFAINVAMGVPIVTWQIGQRYARAKSRRLRTGAHSDEEDARRTRNHRPTAR